MKEFLTFLKAAVGILPCRLGTVQHDCSAQNIGLNKNFGIADASVHMAFRRKMHHSVNVIFRKNLFNRFLITDVGFNKGIVLPLLQIFQIFQIAGIGEGIHIDNPDFVVIFPEHIVDVIGTNKSCAACYQISSHIFLLRLRLKN